MLLWCDCQWHLNRNKDLRCALYIVQTGSLRGFLQYKLIFYLAWEVYIVSSYVSPGECLINSHTQHDKRAFDGNRKLNKTRVKNGSCHFDEHSNSADETLLIETVEK